MNKLWKVLPWIAALVLEILIPALYGWVIAIYGAGTACTTTAAWVAWLKLCIVGTYVMLTVTGPGMIAFVVIAATVARIIYIIRH